MNFRTYSSPWTETLLYPLAVSPHFPPLSFSLLPHFYEPTYQFSVSVDLTVLGILCNGIIQHVFFCDWLLLLCMFSRFIPVIAHIRSSLLFIADTIPLCGCLVFSGGAFGLFPVFGSFAWSSIVIWIYPVLPSVCIPACKVNLILSALFFWLYPGFRYAIFTCETLLTEHLIP